VFERCIGAGEGDAQSVMCSCAYDKPGSLPLLAQRSDFLRRRR
jgi:hypothetical protein